MLFVGFGEKREMKTMERRAGPSALWSLHASAKEVWQLLRSGIDAPLYASNLLEQDLRALAAPHMAVLVHKRAKLAGSGGSDPHDPWLAELSAFAERVGRYLAAELGDDRERVIVLLDGIVAGEQQRLAAAEADPIPVTSRFDMCWAH